MEPEGRALPSGVVRGSLKLPGSKSATNRWLVLSLFAEQPVHLDAALHSEDTDLLVGALRTLGFEVASSGDTLSLNPGPAPASASLECGASGTMLRFLTAALCTIPGHWRLDGVPRLRQRPVGPLVRALRELGADIACPAGEGLAPIEITGGRLRGGRVVLDAGQSSQFVSALLLAGLGAEAPIEIAAQRLTSRPYAEMTVDAITCAGGRATRDGDTFRVEPGRLRGGRFAVEPDLSSAGYAAAGAAVSGGEIELEGVRPGSGQPDAQFLAVLEMMGARLVTTARGLLVRGAGLEAVSVDAGDFPDQGPTLAAIAPFAAGTTEIRGVGHLRLKESDRLREMSTMLRRAGASVDERSAGLTVPGVWAQAQPPSATALLDPAGDHRIAMSSAVLGLRRPGLRLRHPEVVMKSYPGFWQDWLRIVYS